MSMMLANFSQGKLYGIVLAVSVKIIITIALFGDVF